MRQGLAGCLERVPALFIFERQSILFRPFPVLFLFVSPSLGLAWSPLWSQTYDEQRLNDVIK
jgi:hypothetical protein